jgi:hypothetical protein
MAMYKGFVPTWVRLGPWNIIVSLTHREKKNIAQFHLLMLTSQLNPQKYGFDPLYHKSENFRIN